jgi:carbon monoxide dehydrogenase subunit G
VGADESAHRAVIRADGKDARGQGTASATITSTLSEQDGGVHVVVETDMQLTGRVAQFGRGMHKEVASKVMGRFAECLEKEL